MQPAVVFPLHDPDGSMFPRLQDITPILQQNFRDAYVLVTSETREKWPENIRWLSKNPFFRLTVSKPPLSVGEQFNLLYKQAALGAPPEQQLHLCYLDRLAFAIQTGYQSQFLTDIRASAGETAPLIFQRSEKAWETHPRNYFEVEGFITRIGRSLFGKTLDYAWCHLGVRAQTLGEIMPFVKSPAMSMVGEMVLLLQDSIKTKEVDWLAWEDPFILSCDPSDLKKERENSPAETRKRLAYALPIIENLVQYSLKKDLPA